MSHNAETIIGKINKLDFIKIRNVRIKKKKKNTTISKVIMSVKKKKDKKIITQITDKGEFSE